jgi:hypothetical protein
MKLDIYIQLNQNNQISEIHKIKDMELNPLPDKKRHLIPKPL